MIRATQRLRRLMALTAGASALGLAASAAVAASAFDATAPVEVGRQYWGMRAFADGTVRTVEARPGRDGGARVTMRRIDPAGAGAAPLVFADPDPRADFASAAIKPDGGVVALISKSDLDDVTFINESLSVVDVAPNGARSAPQSIEIPGEDVFLGNAPYVGPTGATLVVLDDGKVAFRPAGASTFPRAVNTLRAEAEQRASMHAVAMAPDGGAAILWAPLGRLGQPFVQRIGQSGALGPRITLSTPVRRSFIPDLEYSPAGDLSIAVQIGATKRARPQVLFTRLRANSNTPDPLQTLPASLGLTIDREFALDLAVGPDGSAALLVGREPDGLRLFTGTGQLRRVATFERQQPEGGTVLVGADGRITALWEESAGERSQIVATTGTSAGGFTAPHTLFPRRTSYFYGVDDAALLPDGRLGLVYSEIGRQRDRELARIVRP